VRSASEMRANRAGTMCSSMDGTSILECQNTAMPSSPR
jgi:hypothetical protein